MIPSQHFLNRLQSGKNDCFLKTIIVCGVGLSCLLQSRMASNFMQQIKLVSRNVGNCNNQENENLVLLIIFSNFRELCTALLLFLSIKVCYFHTLLLLVFSLNLCCPLAASQANFFLIPFSQPSVVFIIFAKFVLPPSFL